MPPRSSNTRILVAVLAGAATLGVSMSLVGALESWMNADLAVPHSMTGLAQSSLFAGNLLGSMAMGWLIYRVSSRRLITAAMVLMAVGSALSGLRIYEPIVLGRLITGLGYAGALIFFNASLAQAFASRQAVFLNLYHAAFAGSAALTLLVARPVAQALGGWHVTFWISGLICLALLALLRGVQPPSLSGDQPFSRRAFFAAMRRTTVAATLAMMAMYMVGEQAMTVFIGTYALNEMGLTAQAAAEIAMLFWAGILCGRLSSAGLSGRLSEAPQLLVCLAGMALVLLFGMTLPLAGAAYVAAFLAGLFAGPVVPLMFSVAVRGASGMKSAVVSMVNVSNCAGGVVGPVLIGFIADRASFQAGLVFSGVLLLIGIVPYWAALRRSAGCHEEE